MKKLLCCLIVYVALFVSSGAAEPDNLELCSTMDRFSAAYEELKGLAEYFKENLRDNVKALKCYEAMTQVSSKFAGAWADLASHQHYLGMRDEAVVSWKKCMELSPRNFAAHVNLGNIYREMGDLYTAKSLFDKALLLEGANSAALNNLGILYYDMGDLKNSFTAFQKSLEINPESAEGHYNMGNILRDHGSFLNAINEYQKSLRIDPNSFTSRLNLAICYSELGRQESAREILVDILKHELSAAKKSSENEEKDINKVYNLTTVYYNLGVVYYKLGRDEDAAKAFWKSKEYSLAARAMESISLEKSWKISQRGTDRGGYSLRSRMAVSDWNSLEHLMSSLYVGVPEKWMDKFNSKEGNPKRRKANEVLPYNVHYLSILSSERLANMTRMYADSTAVRAGRMGLSVFEHFDLEDVYEKQKLNFGLLAFDLSSVEDNPVVPRQASLSMYSFLGPNGSSTLRGLSTMEVAEKIYSEDIDVLLVKENEDGRTPVEVAVLHPAKIQIGIGNGWSGVYDYSILPSSQLHLKVGERNAHYIVLPPLSALLPANEGIGKHSETRNTVAFPVHSRVYLTPNVLATVMNVLLCEPHLVFKLPLVSSKEKLRIRMEAAARGVDPSRISFFSGNDSGVFDVCVYPPSRSFLDDSDILVQCQSYLILDTSYSQLEELLVEAVHGNENLAQGRQISDTSILCHKAYGMAYELFSMQEKAMHILVM